MAAPTWESKDSSTACRAEHGLFSLYERAIELNFKCHRGGGLPLLSLGCLLYLAPTEIMTDDRQIHAHLTTCSSHPVNKLLTMYGSLLRTCHQQLTGSSQPCLGTTPLPPRACDHGNICAVTPNMLWCASCQTPHISLLWLEKYGGQGLEMTASQLMPTTMRG
jgi:hypothetical protein